LPEGDEEKERFEEHRERWRDSDDKAASDEIDARFRGYSYLFIFCSTSTLLKEDSWRLNQGILTIPIGHKADGNAYASQD
jgi:hypothetical protein